jgi:hypothetical protein
VASSSPHLKAPSFVDDPRTTNVEVRGQPSFVVLVRILLWRTRERAATSNWTWTMERHEVVVDY